MLIEAYYKDILGKVFHQTFKKINEIRQSLRVKDVN